MEDLKEFTGFLIIASMAVLSFRYVLKFVFKKYGKQLDESLRAKLVSLMTFNKKIHPFVAYAAVGFVVLHVYVVTGFNLRFNFTELSGIFAASFIILNIIVGILGQYVMTKPRPKWFKFMHRLLTVLAIITIIIHVD